MIPGAPLPWVPTAASTSSVNVALAANGASAAASSQLSANFPPSSAINGSRTAAGWGSGSGGWACGTPNTWPDWLEVTFAESSSIQTINVIGIPDNFGDAPEPTLSMVATEFPLTDFVVEYWDGSAWATVPGGNVTGNDKVWRQFTFIPITTTKIRVYITAGYAYSIICELEAWT